VDVFSVFPQKRDQEGTGLSRTQQLQQNCFHHITKLSTKWYVEWSDLGQLDLCH
jgi:hypothetical protein